MNLFHPDTAVILSLVLSVLIPALSSLLSRTHWPSEVTALLTLLIAGANGLFTEWAAAPHHYDWKTALALAVQSFVIAAIARVVVWKGTATDAKLLAVGSKA